MDNSGHSVREGNLWIQLVRGTASQSGPVAFISSFLFLSCFDTLIFTIWPVRPITGALHFNTSAVWANSAYICRRRTALFPLCLGPHVQPNRPVSDIRNPPAEPTPFWASSYKALPNIWAAYPSLNLKSSLFLKWVAPWYDGIWTVIFHELRFLWHFVRQTKVQEEKSLTCRWERAGLRLQKCSSLDKSPFVVWNPSVEGNTPIPWGTWPVVASASIQWAGLF